MVKQRAINGQIDAQYVQELESVSSAQTQKHSIQQPPKGGLRMVRVDPHRSIEQLLGERRQKWRSQSLGRPTAHRRGAGDIVAGG